MSPPIMSSPATDFYKIINSVSFQDFPKGGWHECMDIIRQYRGLYSILIFLLLSQPFFFVPGAGIGFQYLFLGLSTEYGCPVRLSSPTYPKCFGQLNRLDKYIVRCLGYFQKHCCTHFVTVLPKKNQILKACANPIMVMGQWQCLHLSDIQLLKGNDFPIAVTQFL